MNYNVSIQEADGKLALREHAFPLRQYVRSRPLKMFYGCAVAGAIDCCKAHIEVPSRHDEKWNRSWKSD